MRNTSGGCMMSQIQHRYSTDIAQIQHRYSSDPADTTQIQYRINADAARIQCIAVALFDIS
eukprot:6331582-Prymnesium_polylepis.1